MPALGFLDLPAEIRIEIFLYLLPSHTIGQYDALKPEEYVGLRLSCRTVKTEFDHEFVKAMALYVQKLPEVFYDRFKIQATVNMPASSSAPSFVDTSHLEICLDTSSNVLSTNMVYAMLDSLICNIRSVSISLCGTSFDTGHRSRLPPTTMSGTVRYMHNHQRKRRAGMEGNGIEKVEFRWGLEYPADALAVWVQRMSPEFLQDWHYEEIHESESGPSLVGVKWVFNGGNHGGQDEEELGEDAVKAQNGRKRSGLLKFLNRWKS